VKGIACFMNHGFTDALYAKREKMTLAITIPTTYSVIQDYFI
jgi:hypothetical protein